MRRQYVTMALVLILALIISSMGMAQEKILPSKMRQDLKKEIQQKIRSKEVKSQSELQVAIAKYLKSNLPKVQTKDLPVEETLILGEMFASSGDIKKTRRTLATMAMGSDINARRANQLMINASIGANKLPEAENQIRQYRKKFKPTPDDLGHLSQAIFTLMMKYKESDKPGKAVKVFTDQLKTMPTDQPYKLFSTLPYTKDIFEEAGKTPELVTILKDLIVKFEKSAAAHDAAVNNKQAVRYANSSQAFRMMVRSYQGIVEQLEMIGSPAPDIEFTRFYNTEKITLASLKGKVVMIDFWANWCGPCKVAFPSMAELYAKYKDKGFVILGVTSLQGRFNDGNIRKREIGPEEEIKLTEDFIKRHKMTWPVVFSRKSVFNPDYGVSGIPTFAVLDKEGNIRMVKTGAGEDAEKALHKLVEKLIKE